MFCVLSLVAITGARTLIIRDQAESEAGTTLQAAVGGPSVQFMKQIEVLLTSDQQWQELRCYTSDGKLRFEGVRSTRGILATDVPRDITEDPRVSFATVVLQVDGTTGRCSGRYQALNKDQVYPIIRDTALASIFLLVFGALTLVAISLRSRNTDPKPTLALGPPSGPIPGTANSSPANPSSETIPQTRHAPR